MTSRSAKPVFIHLLHGRDDPAEDMRDWGYTGPVLGPFAAAILAKSENVSRTCSVRLTCSGAVE